MAKLRLTITKEYDTDNGDYTNVEWPAGSGERKDLTTPADMAAYDQWMLNNNEVGYDDLLTADENTNVVCRVEVVEEPQTMEPRPVGENPFLAATETGEKTAPTHSSATSTDGSESVDPGDTREADDTLDRPYRKDNVVGDQGAVPPKQ